jgi:hypothetical protein
MATIEVKGSESTVTVIEIDWEEGLMGLECSKGQQCRNFRDISDFQTKSWADLMDEAQIHADKPHGGDE